MKHTLTHARTHARTHAHTHTYTGGKIRRGPRRVGASVSGYFLLFPPSAECTNARAVLKETSIVFDDTHRSTFSVCSHLLHPHLGLQPSASPLSRLAVLASTPFPACSLRLYPFPACSLGLLPYPGFQP